MRAPEVLIVHGFARLFRSHPFSGVVDKVLPGLAAVFRACGRAAKSQALHNTLALKVSQLNLKKPQKGCRVSGL